jgi:hypothetical protein
MILNPYFVNLPPSEYGFSIVTKRIPAGIRLRRNMGGSISQNIHVSCATGGRMFTRPSYAILRVRPWIRKYE